MLFAAELYRLRRGAKAQPRDADIAGDEPEDGECENRYAKDDQREEHQAANNIVAHRSDGKKPGQARALADLLRPEVCAEGARVTGLRLADFVREVHVAPAGRVGVAAGQRDLR